MAKADIARRGRLRESLGLATQRPGLLLAGERRNIKAVAHRLAEEPSEPEASRQRMQQEVVVAKWNEDEVFERICAEMHRRISSIEALVIDDTGSA